MRRSSSLLQTAALELRVAARIDDELRTAPLEAEARTFSSRAMLRRWEQALRILFGQAEDRSLLS